MIHFSAVAGSWLLLLQIGSLNPKKEICHVLENVWICDSLKCLDA